MKFDKYEWAAISIMLFLFIIVGFVQGWSVSLVILNMCIISAIMTMGVNISWGYAGVINFGVMGFLAMGGLAAVLVSYPPIKESWQVGGFGLSPEDFPMSTVKEWKADVRNLTRLGKFQFLVVRVHSQ